MADRPAERPAGDSSAATVVTRLFEDHGDAVEAVARGLLRDGHLAADVSQVVFSKALTRLDDIPEGAERAWLLRVAKNEAIDVLRKRGRERRHIEASMLPGPVGRSDHEGVSGERQLIQDETAAVIREVLDELPEFDREIARRRFEQGKTFAVIAEEMEKPLGTVLSRAHRLMKTLESRLRSLHDLGH